MEGVTDLMAEELSWKPMTELLGLAARVSLTRLIRVSGTASPSTIKLAPKNQCRLQHVTEPQISDDGGSAGSCPTFCASLPRVVDVIVPASCLESGVDGLVEDVRGGLGCAPSAGRPDG